MHPKPSASYLMFITFPAIVLGELLSGRGPSPPLPYAGRRPLAGHQGAPWASACGLLGEMGLRCCREVSARKLSDPPSQISSRQRGEGHSGDEKEGGTKSRDPEDEGTGKSHCPAPRPDPSLTAFHCGCFCGGGWTGSAVGRTRPSSGPWLGREGLSLCQSWWEEETETNSRAAAGQSRSCSVGASAPRMPWAGPRKLKQPLCPVAASS